MTNFLFENLAHLSRSVPSKRENHTSNIETKTHWRFQRESRFVCPPMAIQTSSGGECCVHANVG